MKTKIYFIFLILIGNACFGQNKILQVNIQYYTEKAQNYLDKEKALSGYYSIDTIGIKMFATANDKSIGKAEFNITWAQLKNYSERIKSQSSESLLSIYKTGQMPAISEVIYLPAKLNSEKKLSGYKIALDAGHIANDNPIGDLEKKHIKFKSDSTKGINDSIEISEGMLTIATATLLKKKLENEGAEVFMTRVNGFNAFGIPFEEWLHTNYAIAVDSLFYKGKFTSAQKQWLLGPKALPRDKFRDVFKDLELEKRAQLINDFHPDFTICIHYNVDETNFGWNKPSTKNFNMAFVAGAFMKNDLMTIEKRFEFLRILLTDDLEKSIALSGSVIQNFEKTLNVKTASINSAKYIVNGCLTTKEKGVYCRNLQLPRYIHSPIVYGETLYQDNISECKLLNEESDKTKNKRVQQVADAYFNGIINYVANNYFQK